MTSCCYWGDDGLHLRLHIKPGAKKTGWVSIYGDRIKLQIAATPVKGKANQQLIDFIADFFSVPKKKIIIIRGETSQQKDIVIKMTEQQQVRIILENLLRELNN